tara:strand:- start:965 stop:1606 length:642 start_codon:yes stop_codon:yes gene_type:complete
MKDNSILNKVRELLGMEVKLEQRKLEDGVTIIEADAFEAGTEVVIVTEDEQKIPLPIGEYKMEDGMLLVVTEEGLIAEIKEEEAEEEVVEEEAKKEKEYEEEVEATTEEAKPIKKTVESIVKETFFSEMEALKKENEDLKAQLEKLSKVETVEETVESTEKTKEEVVELSEEVEAAAKPITHNPENKKKTEHIQYSAKRQKTTLDRVMDKLSK